MQLSSTSRRQTYIRIIGTSILVALATALVPLAAGWAEEAVSTVPSSVVEDQVLAAASVPDVDADLDEVNSEPAADDPGVVEAPIRTNLVGVETHRDGGPLYMRARGADDTWSQWIEVPFPEGEGPDADTAEGRRTYGGNEPGEVHRSTPVWVGDATHVQVGFRGAEPGDVELTYVNSTGTATATDRAITRLRDTAAEVLDTAEAPLAEANPARPAITRRRGWGADESKRRGAPAYASTLKAATVHHTVTANGYSCSESKALVRGIYAGHLAQGWNDIGYNFLIDRCGRIFEGRFGGIARPVIGAHALGFNTGTVGVAFIGTHGSAAPSPAARSALKKLLSWRLDVAHVNPTRTTKIRSHDSGSRYKAGTYAKFRGIFGHRDAFATECPGGAAYSRLGGFRSATWNMGGPKLATPRQNVRTNADGMIEHLRVRADGNRRMNWQLRIEQIDTGKLLRRIRSTGTTFDRSWNGIGNRQRHEPWNVRWRLSATSNGRAARPFTMSRVGKVPPRIRLTYRGRRPWTFSPNGDGISDRVKVAYTANTGSRLNIELVDRNGARSMIRRNVVGKSGTRSISWGGRVSKATQPMGTYRLRVTGTDARDNTATFTSHPFALDDTLALPRPHRRVYSPNGDGRADLQRLYVRIRGDSPRVRVVLRRKGGGFKEVLHDGAVNNRNFVWKLGARSPAGTTMRNGTYILFVRATSSLNPKWKHELKRTFVRNTRAHR